MKLSKPGALIKCYSLVMVFVLFISVNVYPQNLLPQNTKWYQDPLGFRPLGLSGPSGFIWGTAATISTLIFSKKLMSEQKDLQVFIESDYGFGYKKPYTNNLFFSAGIVTPVRRNISIGYRMSYLTFTNKYNYISSLAIQPFSRWNIVTHNKINLQVEYGAGISYSSKQFPVIPINEQEEIFGTRFNFITKYGLNVSMKIAKNTGIEFGIRHAHLSNGGLGGKSRNPSYDNNGFHLGANWKINNE